MSPLCQSLGVLLPVRFAFDAWRRARCSRGRWSWADVHFGHFRGGHCPLMLRWRGEFCQAVPR